MKNKNKISVVAIFIITMFFLMAHATSDTEGTVFAIGLVLGITFLLWQIFGGLWKNNDTNNKILDDTISQKSKLPKIKFKDSGWVLVYVICGWICCVCSLIIVLIGAFGGSFKSSVIAALPILFAGLGSLLAAHILRLLEKGVHHLESGVHHLKSIDENKKPPN